MTSSRDNPPARTLDIRLKQFSDVDAFVRGYHAFFLRGGMLLKTGSPPDIGTTLAFRMALADGQPVMQGQAIVRKHRSDSQGKPVAAILQFTRLDRDGKALLDRMLEAREANPRFSGSHPTVAPQPARRTAVTVTAAPQQGDVEELGAAAGALASSLDDIFDGLGASSTQETSLPAAQPTSSESPGLGTASAAAGTPDEGDQPRAAAADPLALDPSPLEAESLPPKRQAPAPDARDDADVLPASGPAQGALPAAGIVAHPGTDFRERAGGTNPGRPALVAETPVTPLDAVAEHAERSVGGRPAPDPEPMSPDRLPLRQDDPIDAPLRVEDTVVGRPARLDHSAEIVLSQAAETVPMRARSVDDPRHADDDPSARETSRHDIGAMIREITGDHAVVPDGPDVAIESTIGAAHAPSGPVKTVSMVAVDAWLDAGITEAAATETDEQAEEHPEEETPKRGFWSRLFGRD